MAQETCERLSLDSMIMLPAGNPPHRSGVSSSEHRLNMLNAAVADYPRLTVDAREVLRGQRSWSVISCREYRAEYPDAVIYWCMGSDAFALFHTWHAWAEILSLVNIAVIARSGAPLSPNSEVWQHLDRDVLQSQPNARAGSVVCLSLNKIAVSSSQIRTQLKSQHTPPQGLPEPVSQYIINHKLYSQ